MRRFLRSLCGQALAIFVIAFTLTVLTIRTVTATVSPIGWVWYASSATFETKYAPTYRSVVQFAAAHYDSQTDLLVGHISYEGSGNGYIKYIEGNYGVTSWTGLATPYNALGQACANVGQITGNCNTTDKKAVRATINIDLADSSFLNQGTNAQYVMIHEAGHVFGMAHPDCFDPAQGSAVMLSGTCDKHANALVGEEKSWLNNRY